MKIDCKKNGDNLHINLEGRLDTTTAQEFESALLAHIVGVKALTINCAGLEYVSSAGLRVLLSAQKKMQGAMTLENVGELVMEVFEITGFVDILTIK